MISELETIQTAFQSWVNKQIANWSSEMVCVEQSKAVKEIDSKYRQWDVYKFQNILCRRMESTHDYSY